MLIFQGIFVARGKQLLFADADGASKFSDLDKLETAMDKIKKSNNLGIVCGSRAHLEQESIAQVRIVIEVQNELTNMKRVLVTLATW